MAHLTQIKQSFLDLIERLDKNPIGAPFADSLIEILQILYTEEEAKIGANFPLHATTTEDLAKRLGLETEKLEALLNTMANKGLVVDTVKNGKTYWRLTPLMIGLFEFTFMRTGTGLPMKRLAELMHRYRMEDGLGKEFFGSETQMSRTLVFEDLIKPIKTEVLPYEKASEIIRQSKIGSLQMCYCRHEAQHRGTVCDAPIEDVCTALGPAADYLIRRGFARKASVDEMLEVLDRTEKLGLVHIADNVQEGVAFICHCCSCCCGLLAGINKLDIPNAVAPSGFLPKVDMEVCVGCGLCAERCPVNAIELEDLENKPIINADRCLGCGVCASGCPTEAITMVRRENWTPPPRNTAEKFLRIAKEKGKI
ncbi:MAG: 4Fe-4S binding protein [Deltaproteobacteria bacterium]|nr:4Fe-4S binding protein [Deltaproteobacteria bacterium]